MDLDPYAILGVARECSTEELKSAYRRLARENHPDVAPDKSAATIRMTQINAAWGIVGDPQKRAGYDVRCRLEERERTFKERFNRQPPPPPGSRPAPSVRVKAPRYSPPARGKSSKEAHAGQTPNETSPPPPKAGSRRMSAPMSRHARLAEASRLLFKQNKPNEAIEMCRAILKTDFRNIPARELMGEAYLRLGHPDKAIAVWEQALVLAPSNLTLRRRWLNLMSPDMRAVYERKIPSPTAPPRAPTVPPPMSPRRQNVIDKGLLGRLLARLGSKR